MADVGLIGVTLVEPLTQDVFDNLRTALCSLSGVTICAKHRILKLVDTSGNAISGASVSLSDARDYSESGTTEADGTFSSFLNGDNITNPVTMEISKSGYLTESRTFDCVARIDWLVVLAADDEITVNHYIPAKEIKTAVQSASIRSQVQKNCTAQVQRKNVRGAVSKIVQSKVTLKGIDDDTSL